MHGRSIASAHPIRQRGRQVALLEALLAQGGSSSADHLVEIAAAPDPESRAHLLPAIKEANALIKAALARLPNTGFTDIYTPMLGADGQPDATLFREDMLHMTPAGYAIWTKALAPKVNCN